MSFSIWSCGLTGLLFAVILPPFQCNGAAVQAGAVLEPDPAAAEIASGIRLLSNRQPTAAKVRFSAAVRANPRSTDALTWRGITENQLKEYREATLDFNAALRIDPSNLPAHYNLALSLIRMGQDDGAIEHLKAVVNAQPGVLEPEYNLAILLERKHATEEAVQHLQAAYRARQNDVGVIQHLLVDLFLLGRADEAQPILEQLLTIASPEVQQQVGKSLLEAGQFSQAIPLLENAHAQAQPKREADILLARAYIGAQEDAKAINLLSPAETTDGTGESAYWLGMAYSDTGVTQEARHAFEYAIKANPRNGRAFYHLGMIEAITPEKMPAAIRDLREATRLEPRNPTYGIILGKILLQHDDAQGAIVSLQQVHSEGLEAAERDLLLGIAQITVSGARQAIPTLTRAASEDPSLALTQNMLGFCYFVQGDLAKAAASYRRASDLSPQTRIYAHGAAVAFDLLNDRDQAMVYAARAVALPEATGEDHYLVGKLSAKAGRKEDAIRELNEAIALNPDLDASYYLMARTYMQMGETAKATEWIARLKELKQKHERTYAEAVKNAKSIKSSTLLQGAPMAGPEAEAP